MRSRITIASRLCISIENSAVEKTQTKLTISSAGQEEYSAMREHYMRSGDGYVIVYSIDSQDSFKEAQALYEVI